jgi:PAS domain S-box-containing protein
MGCDRRGTPFANAAGKEARFRAVVQSVPNAILLVDAHGVIRFANAPAQTVFGYTPEDLVGKSVDELVPAQARGRHETNRLDYMRSATARAMGAGRELFGRRRDGSEIPVEVGLNPMVTEATSSAASART